ncbi:MAG TPA: 1-(5-phosphoribosyl)-5-[(5-phosphoribosylamino)methylideneamino]imidazole-4-carboxamide isomerase [Bacillota bacterium]|nr:1-(5-phosphoribosyl)-5-[(5-phosphoribosylamino)methylideneamino]imidazole-4-carboxamide isomerase [Bacillota bacterium]
MIIFPAIDIKDGKCVRLTQGDYDKETIYNHSPLAVAKQWEQKGAEYLHLVDLNGAKEGKSVNEAIIFSIAKETNIPIQVGGGIRSIQTVESFISAGVDRVIVGTAAINDRHFLKKAVQTYGKKIAVSIDARNGYVATDGWTKTSTIKAVDLLKELEKIGVTTIVYTDIHKDGMLAGPNIEELKMINEQTNIHVVASGGITTKNDVAQVQQLNVYGAIIGKALYDGTLSFEDLL